jgi:hypothetical protein
MNSGLPGGIDRGWSCAQGATKERNPQRNLKETPPLERLVDDLAVLQPYLF